jgi:hypothetical protein
MVALLGESHKIPLKKCLESFAKVMAMSDVMSTFQDYSHYS